MTKSKLRTKLNRNRRSARNANRKPLAKSINRRLDHQTAQPDCPYRAGTLYATTFVEGNHRQGSRKWHGWR